MSESTLRSKVVAALRKAGLDAYPVENPAWPGTPDINFTLGWVELKQEDRWPVSEDTPLRVPHFTQNQRLWLERRCRARMGRAYMLIQVDRDYLLLWGATAAELLGHVPREQLMKAATRHWTSLSSMLEDLPQELANGRTA